MRQRVQPKLDKSQVAWVVRLRICSKGERGILQSNFKHVASAAMLRYHTQLVFITSEMENAMKNLLIVFTAAGLLMTPVAGTAQQRPAEPKNIPDSINFIWKSIERDFTSLAEAMPEDKWSFKPTQGEFKGVRSFAEQVKHVACANEAWAKQIVGEKPPARCDLGGPNQAKTKAEILAYLHDSFSLADKAIADTSADNLLHPNPGPYWGTNRLSALTALVWHISDHYGQLVEYLRMNGIVPPASR